MERSTIYSEFSHEKMVIFHSYVSLPEGNPNISHNKPLVGGDWNHGILNDFP
jgi:hypothetical protein